MTQVCFEATYFGAQHILDRANNSSYGTLRSKSGMCLICPNHECAHFRPFWAIFHIICQPCTMFSPFVHA